MRRLSVNILFFLLLAMPAMAVEINIIPTPQSIEVGDGSYRLQNAYSVSIDSQYVEQAKYMIDCINDYTRLTGRVVERGEPADIVFKQSNSVTDAYSITIDDKGILVGAGDKGGVINGITTLLQLVFDARDFGYVDLPEVKICDHPKYAYRSFMLDSGRQYQTKKFIKRYLREMAMLKLNVFHWHLTETDGWRIEIDKYPKLTSVGSEVADLPEQQGYYTKEDIAEIVEYARMLNISVMPEIDVPGHAHAAIESYPEMGCFKSAPGEYEGFHSPYLFCAGREETYKFLENVLDEVCELFDYEYIHLGGDEAPKAHWDKCPDCQAMIKRQGLKDSHDLQIYFSKRLAEYLETKGRKAVFWEDVMDSDGGIKMPSNTVIHWWNFKKNEYKNYQKALDQGLDIICGPNYYTYLYFTVTPWGPLKWARTFDLKTAYEENPAKLENPPKQVLGMSCAMWGDHNGQEYMIDRRVFPRIYALSEQMWSLAEPAPFAEFFDRVKSKYEYLKFKGIDYGPALTEECAEDYRWN